MLNAAPAWLQCHPFYQEPGPLVWPWRLAVWAADKEDTISPANSLRTNFGGRVNNYEYQPGET